MWLDGLHVSTPVASLEFGPTDDGTRFTHAEHGVFFDQFWADGPARENGTRGLLEALQLPRATHLNDPTGVLAASGTADHLGGLRYLSHEMSWSEPTPGRLRLLL